MLAGKRQRKNKKVPEVTVVLLDSNDTEKSANPGEWYHLKYEVDGFILLSVKSFWNVSVAVRQSGRRKISEVTDVPCEDLEAEAGSKCTFLCQFGKMSTCYSAWLKSREPSFSSTAHPTKDSPPCSLGSRFTCCRSGRKAVYSVWLDLIIFSSLALLIWCSTNLVAAYLPE